MPMSSRPSSFHVISGSPVKDPRGFDLSDEVGLRNTMEGCWSRRQLKAQSGPASDLRCRV